MSKCLFLIAAIFTTAIFAQAQETKSVSLENWDLGAVKVITEPKPQPVSKNKAASDKTTAAKKSGTTDAKNEKTAAKPANKEADKTISSANGTAKDSSTVSNIIDLNTSSISTNSTAENQAKPALTGRVDLDKIIDSASKESGVDPNLIYSVMHQESGFHSNAVSSKGARGLMQLIPATARRFGVQDIFDPKQNVHAGAKYLRFLLDTFDGDVELALAGYNAGENAVIKYGYRVPPYSETQNYVRSIVSRYGQKTLRPTDVTARVRTLSAPIIIATSEKGVLLLSNNY